MVVSSVRLPHAAQMASIASSSEMANSASFKAEAELLDDTNNPDVPSW